MGRLFGTDGVRGVANLELTPELVFRLGFAATRELSAKRDVCGEAAAERPFVVVGKDTRQSGDMLEAALVAGILSAGMDVWRLGVLPTPGVAYVTRTVGAVAGVMISASHNPMEDNGIKFFGPDGFKLLDAQEDDIERRLQEPMDTDRPVGSGVGRVRDRLDLKERYAGFLRQTVRHSFAGLRVAVDAANGAAHELAREVLEALGAEVLLFHGEPDGLNINVGCGSTHPEEIVRLTLETGAHVGLSFDGDADRLMAADERGGLVDGDRMMLICGRDLRDRGLLRGHTVVTTVMSNYGFVKAARVADIELVRTSVGDRYVMEAMREGGYVLGGEQSGHIIFLQHNTTGDGLLTALQLLDVMIDRDVPLGELAQVMRSYPQTLINVRVRDKNAWRTNAAVAQAIADVEARLGDDGRILVRESGTEPIVRVMVEAPDHDAVREYAEAVADVVRAEFGEGLAG